MRIAKIALVPFLTMLCYVCIGQANVNNLLLSDTIAAGVYTRFIDGIGGSSLLYNGPEYINNYRSIKGSPYFDANDFETGTVWYNGIRYTNIPLKYDLASGDVVTKGFQNESISLVREKVDSFYLQKHLFAKVAGDSSSVSATGYRFYDVLYNGKNVQLVVKRERGIKAAINAEDPSLFINYTSYYLVRESVFYKADSKKEVISALGKSNDAMKTFWKSNHLNFKKEPANAIRTAAEYFDQLKK